MRALLTLTVLFLTYSVTADVGPRSLKESYVFSSLEPTKVQYEEYLDVRFKSHKNRLGRLKSTGHSCYVKHYPKYLCYIRLDASELPVQLEQKALAIYEGQEVAFGAERAFPELTHESDYYLEYKIRRSVDFMGKRMPNFVYQVFSNGLVKIESRAGSFIRRGDDSLSHLLNLSTRSGRGRIRAWIRGIFR